MESLTNLVFDKSQYIKFSDFFYAKCRLPVNQQTNDAIKFVWYRMLHSHVFKIVKVRQDKIHQQLSDKRIVQRKFDFKPNL